MTNLIAYKSNWLVEASYKMSLQEQRFILSCIGKIDSRKPIPKSIVLTAKELLANFPDIGKSNVENVLRDAVDKLWQRSVIVSDPEQTEEFRWIDKRIRYHKGEARVMVRFSEDIAKYITQMSEQFTKVALKNVSGLKSSYSIRIYELCQQFVLTKEREISVKKFREIMQLEDAYQEFKTLNRDVIQPSLKELNSPKSNLTIEIKTLKTGRKITHLRFTFTENSQLGLPLDEPHCKAGVELDENSKNLVKEFGNKS
jgi:plasmid replication initiation protein